MSTPKMMKAVVLRAFGDAEALEYGNVARPAPGPGEVLVKVACCGVCHLDLILRKGMRSRLKLPRILGHELAGTVESAGEGVQGFEAGDRVTSFNFQACGTCPDCVRGHPSLCRNTSGDIGQTRDGGYAEYACLRAGNLEKIPQDMPFEHACFAACVFGPPYKALRQVGQIRAGQWVVITGASGGLGLAAIQIARALGAHSIAITSDENKAEALRKAGADHVLVSKDGTFGDDVRKLTDGRGVDLAVELIGSPTFGGSLRSLAPGGRCAVIGELHGTPVQLNLGLLIIKEWEIHGVQSASGEELAEILAFMHEHRIEPTVCRRLPLSQAATAHRLLEDRAVIGRLLLTP
ncbi:Alcohol dehydrogenase OS=Castellaniella defragrans OX=75697 GN=HNR28_003075 PE=4 SV=1 [Castellaniella defragrans]